ncbi:MAG TPA: hypothetical protein VFT98_14650 [Myxococcota bacterium]|nr:hypothetical protein [Myxococcota bacterium]
MLRYSKSKRAPRIVSHAPPFTHAPHPWKPATTGAPESSCRAQISLSVSSENGARSA